MADVRRIHELMTRGNITIVYSVTEAKSILSAAVHEAAQTRVLIHRHFEPSAVLLGIEDFTALLAKAEAYDQIAKDKDA